MSPRYKNDQLVEYSGDIEASVKTNLSSSPGDPHVSTLVIDSVRPEDSGIYRCGSDLTGDQEAIVTVYVVGEDLKSLHLGTSESRASYSRFGHGLMWSWFLWWNQCYRWS